MICLTAETIGVQRKMQMSIRALDFTIVTTILFIYHLGKDNSEMTEFHVHRVQTIPTQFMSFWTIVQTRRVGTKITIFV